MDKSINTFLLVGIGVFLLWLATSGKLKNIGPAVNILINGPTGAHA